MKKKTTLIILSSLSLLLFLNCGNSTENSEDKENTKDQNAIILDINKILNKNETEVESELGKAEKIEDINGYPCEEKDNCKKAFYKNDKIEIIYKEEKANRITINDTPDFTDKENALKNLGINTEEQSTFKNPGNVIRWENINNISEISFFPDYILIQK